MKTKENQLVIRENRIEADAFILTFKEQYLSAIKAVVAKLKSMGIEQFPFSTISNAITGNYDQVSKAYNKIIESEKNKVESKELKASIESNMSVKFSGLIDLVSKSFAGNLRNDEIFGAEIQDVEEIKNVRSRQVVIPKKSKSLLRFIELNDQLEPVFIESKVRELFADIATPKQTAIIEAQIQAAKSLTEMSDALIDAGQRQDFQIIMSFARKFFSVKKDEETGRFDVIPVTETIALL